jgi:hypothetical protein
VPEEKLASEVTWAAQFVCLAGLEALICFGSQRGKVAATAAWTVIQGRPPQAMLHYAECNACAAVAAAVTAAAVAALLVHQGVNLALAAGASHKWYRRQFKAYPPIRKALVPWVW